jgi:hypothetical protein
MQISKEQINAVRSIELHAVFERLGYDWDRKKYDKDQYSTEKGRISVSGQKFFNHGEEVGGGGAIDLVSHLLDLDFLSAAEWLANEFAGGVSHRQAPIVHSARKKPLALPPRDDAAVGSVFAYLAGRGVSALTIQQLITEGRLYATRNKGFINAVFLSTDDSGLPIGAEQKGVRGKFSALAPGSSRNKGYFRVERAGNNAVAITESAIDAISFAELYPTVDAISTSGSRPDAPYIPHLLDRYEHVFCAFDADDKGHRTAAEMIAKYPRIRRFLPTNVPKESEKWDWNDAVTHAHKLMSQFLPQ